MIARSATVSSITGLGTGVVNSTVLASTLRGSPTARPYTRKVDVSPCARLIENTTSSAVKELPSCHFAARRRVKRHTVCEACDQLSASPGITSRFLPRLTSASYTWPLIALLTIWFCAWGSALEWSFTLAQRKGAAWEADAKRARARRTRSEFMPAIGRNRTDQPARSSKAGREDSPPLALRASKRPPIAPLPVAQCREAEAEAAAELLLRHVHALAKRDDVDVLGTVVDFGIFRKR